MRPLSLALLALACTVGCERVRTDDEVKSTTADGSTTSPAGTEAARQGRSMVRLVNTVAAGGALTLTADDSLVAQSVSNGTVTPYQGVRDNNVVFRLRHDGADTVVASNVEMLSDGARYTLVAMTEPGGSVKLRALRDEVVPDSGKTRFRVIHAVPGLAEVDIVLAGSTDPLFDDLNYGNEGGYRDLAPGRVVIMARDAKTGTLLKRETITMEAGAAYTLVLAGTPRAVQVVSVTDRAEKTP